MQENLKKLMAAIINLAVAWYGLPIDPGWLDFAQLVEPGWNVVLAAIALFRREKPPPED
ncbi:MAG: hypothetical protein VB042_08655 [Victivallaceae bacterium]|nr:hypothetical protein [Victivallaceae bacterium]